jgi:multiple sugar transport system substrate-binding protein
MLGRRSILGSATTLAGTASLGLTGEALFRWSSAWAQEQPFKPEPGAQLRFLRWSRFLDAEDKATTENIRAFTEATGVPVRIDNVWQDDVQPQLSVAANVGSGPDLAWTLHTTPHLFADKLLDLSDVADHIGGKYGGWYPLIEQYGKRDGRWIGISNVVIGVLPVYRVSAMKEAGFQSFPADTDGFLKLCMALKRIGKPAGFAFGRAPSDGNSFSHWLLWSHGGRLVDENNRVALNSPETLRALDYARALASSFIPGTVSWTDASNNSAFLGEQVWLTNNSVSVYAKARADKMAFADDIDHANWPVGPAAQPTEMHLVYPFIAFRYTRYPNAAKAFLTFLLEKPQYEKVLEGSVGYVSHALRAYESSPLWDRDPRIRVFRDVAARGRSVGYAGTLGTASAAALAENIVSDMFGDVVTGQSSPQDAVRSAERRAQRIYRS